MNEELLALYKYAYKEVVKGYANSHELITNKLIKNKNISKDLAEYIASEAIKLYKQEMRNLGKEKISKGLTISIVGILITIVTYYMAQGGGFYIITYGAVMVGVYYIIAGFIHLGN